MKISLEWLLEYVDFADSPERLEEILTNIGFPVEDRQKVGDDWMLDVEVTSNRPDCLGHIGLARELAAATGLAFKMPQVNLIEKGPEVRQLSSVQNEAPQLCRRYTACIIDNVKVAPSPDWFVGVDSLDLRDEDGGWSREVIVELYPWDAGTDSGASYASANAPTNPAEPIFLMPAAPPIEVDGEVPAFGTFTFTLVEQ